MKNLKNILKNKKLLFCYFLFFTSVLFALLLIVFQPQKANAYYPYKYSGKKIENISFPIAQHFHYELDELRSINLFLQNESLNQFNYKIDVIGEKTGHNYFSHKYINYNSNIIILDLNKIPSKDEKDFLINIDCQNCKNVKLSLKESNDKKNYIEGRSDNKVLEFNLINNVTNNSYYWYSLVGIVISLMLYPFAKEEE